MRSAFLAVGLLLLIGGGLLVGGVINLGGSNEVIRLGDTAIDVSREGIRVSDRGESNRNLGIVLMVIGGIGVVVGAVKRK
ncbi:MAG: hypothetical protein ACT4NL_04715 [Pseudomarimonas sp.]